MGKSEQISENVPGLSPQNEASKLLEQALLQMDGIIMGNSGSLTAHSPDYGFAAPPPSVREAAQLLVTALQNSSSPPALDPALSKVILHWIQEVI
ncbi:unnamed protein product [Brassicogethes aeneus]|uniref:Uncharacterized protein n=1 Tax=Brassicogethes aeneus TaxID=1431903 RepID=A0A9P0BAK5_BRAAE|nr:unnamed protein product [Brassicogethes aeneus]